MRRDEATIRARKIIVYAPQSLLPEFPGIGSLERRALDYFFNRVMIVLSGDFEPDFWSKDVIQLARRDGPVKHALLALSSMYEQFSTGVDPRLDQQDFSFHHYGMAVKDLARLDSSKEQALDLVLVTCMLFTVFESLQGHYHAAMGHVKSGMGILVEEQHRKRSRRVSMIHQRTLTRFFLMMETQIRLLSEPSAGISIPSLSGYETTIPDHFLSYESALACLEVLLRDIFELGDRYYCLIADPYTPLGMFQQPLRDHERLKHRVGSWEVSVDSLLGKRAENKSKEQRSAIMILSIYRTYLRVFAERIVQNDDSCYERYLPQFWTGLQKIEEFIHDQPTPKSSNESEDEEIQPSFTLSTGIVPVLCELSTSNCDAGIRKKAIDLLRACKRREGLWDSDLAVRFAQWTNSYKANPDIVPDSLGGGFAPGRKYIMKYRVNQPESKGSEARVEVIEWKS
ncbi:MAG: hypothetical protein M1820_010348 [Bogoriella megaspora]|nr:MAG: hypothetical protein M1820_010348 [Bogoriella megaspora]